MVFVSNAQIGINTQSPNATLDVVNSTSITQPDGIIAPRVSLTNLVDKTPIYGSDQTGAIVYVDDITGTTNVETSLVTTVGYYFFDGMNWQSFTPGGDGSKWSNDAANNLVTLTNTSTGVTRGVANAFVIKDDGSVGIGVSDPDQQLSVGGNMNTLGNIELGQLATTDRPIFMDFHAAVANNPDFEARILRNAGDNGNFAVTNRGSGDIRLDVLNPLSPGVSFAIDGDDGFIGVNKLNPTERLDVVGNGQFTGTVTASGSTLTSDARLKKDIVAIENSLETVQQLNPVFYSKKEHLDSNDYNRKEFGFIAQELQKVLPQLVTQTSREDKLLGVDYISLIPILTKALQEQQKQIAALQQEVVAIKAAVRN